MRIYLRVLRESFLFAVHALRTNLLRTFLSLLGVTIGIFAIIGVLAAIDSLKSQIDEGFSALDISTIYVLRFSFGPTELEPYQYEKFPDVSYDEYEMLKRSVPDMGAITYTMFVANESMKHEGKIATGVNVFPGTDALFDLEGLEIADGRFMSEQESNAGSAVTVLGDEIAQTLFGDADPLGKKVRLYGSRFTVIGTLKKAGNNPFGPSKDVTAYIPVNFMRKKYGDNNRFRTTAMMMRPVKGVDSDEFVAQVEQRLRSYRGLKAGEINTFFINELKGFADFLDQVTGMLTIIGIVIAGFSMLVGGFGIANIMFVSVKERTNLIGIQKSLGAKNKFILSQFLFEAVILALFGGLLGMLMVWLGIMAANSFTEDFTFQLSFFNVLLGCGVSIAVGLIAGIIPAVKASTLDPVEAIRTGM